MKTSKFVGLQDMEFNKIEDAILDIKNGKIVIVADDEDRENEGDLVCAAEKVTPELINFMSMEGRGLICTPVSSEIARRLGFCPMVESNSESSGCNFAISVDYIKGTTTGISAFDRAKTVKAIIDMKSKPEDFLKPGHTFPLIAKDGGVLVRAGHTEAATDLAKLAGFKPAAVICEILWIDGTMARGENLKRFAKAHNLKIVSIKDLIKYRTQKEKLIEKKVETEIPTEYGKFKMVVYEDGISMKQHIALIKGKIDSKKEMLVRVHSECITGEIFKSTKCDCGAQLDFAMKKIGKSGGVLLYLKQEGRGIGLVNKLKAYNLQNKGYDTVEANKMLGFNDDLREYGIGAQILKDIGVKDMILMTNNPRKIVGLDGFGLKIVKRMPIQIKPTKGNLEYLKTKQIKMGHIFSGIFNEN
ncbi:MAG: GTP cyclohydrolase-2, 3,4-dihydroxy 2-butanone 4-phosphate synthase / GTP cyclohydrolase II [Candidatus Peregrinibacteria bacterium GW2011_GWF2_38_29]|nr:MAG: GTP cyclohydrolase-2, 3,4-dihydroxy 2-butanone 4-phosphate synthase / GTP cyclohydrolase II [Candidatus Peregrinibacteria bacterium GW2011_GWF2_38_29]